MLKLKGFNTAKVSLGIFMPCAMLAPNVTYRDVFSSIVKVAVRLCDGCDTETRVIFKALNSVASGNLSRSNEYTLVEISSFDVSQ